MDKCSSGELYIGKGDKLSLEQSPKNELKKDTMKDKPVGILIYAQRYTWSNLAFAVSVLERFQSNHNGPHWVATKKVFRYFEKNQELHAHLWSC